MCMSMFGHVFEISGLVLGCLDLFDGCLNMLLECLNWYVVCVSLVVGFWVDVCLDALLCAPYL